MYSFLAGYIVFLGVVVLNVESNVIKTQVVNNDNIDWSRFKRDLDVLRSFGYTVQLNPIIETAKTYAVMNSDSQVEELHIYHQINLPLDVFCLVHLHTLRVNGTPFGSGFPLEENSISTGLSPLISQLTHLRVLSLTNTTASYIPPHALAVLTNITKLEVVGCGLREIPHTIELLSNLEELRLSHNHLNAMPHVAALQHMAKLEYLNMSHNKIRDITDLAEIASRTVITMDFSYNEIDYIPPEISQFFYDLLYLYLSDNKLSYVPSDIFKLQYLRQADLQRNLFPSDEINAIKAKFRSTITNCLVLI